MSTIGVPDDELAALRAEIDSIDDRLLALLQQRAEIVEEVGRRKDALSRPTVYDATREQQILARLAARGASPLGPDAVRAIFREVIAGCRALQRPTAIAYLGPEGTFSQMAARQTFGDGALLASQTTIDGVFDAVERGEAVRGVVPIENSTDGSVLPTLRRLMSGPLRIERSVVVPIVHQLVSRAGSLAEIREIHSHPQALAQCSGWLQRTLPMARLVPTVSTAAAAEAAAGITGAAAIASAAAGELYALTVLASGIQDRAENATRFVVIGPDISAATGHDRTILSFGLDDGAGALRRALSVFEDHAINLTRIESLSDRDRAWQCSFVVEFDGHTNDAVVAEALEALSTVGTSVRVLGCYAR
jgi:chorismate mutase/prephenate dehydratase